MQVVKLARLAFQLVALCFFAYQMVNAVSKYFRYSTLPLTENKDIAEGKLPTIYICEKDQYDEKQAKLRGYGSNIDTFLSGIIPLTSEKLLTWNGKEKIAANHFKDIIKFLFNAKGFSPVTAELPILHAKHFKGANGFCRHYRTSASILSKTIKIKFFLGFNDKDVEVYIVDPGRNLYYMINTGTVKGDRIETKNRLRQLMIKDDRFEIKTKLRQYFFIHYEEVHQDPNDGRCINYGEEHT